MIEITEDQLFAKLGRLLIENELLRARVAQLEALVSKPVEVPA